jgi:hypothetical protein
MVKIIVYMNRLISKKEENLILGKKRAIADKSSVPNSNKIELEEIEEEMMGVSKGIQTEYKEVILLQLLKDHVVDISCRNNKN